MAKPADPRNVVASACVVAILAICSSRFRTRRLADEPPPERSESEALLGDSSPCNVVTRGCGRRRHTSDLAGEPR
jgi:hypothetical protein